MEKIVSLAKRRGFVFQGSEIYGGLAGTYDYGPMGVLLKENIEKLWLSMFRDSRDDMYGVDAAILMNAKVWEASGHAAGFSDPLVTCKNCHSRFRVDHLSNFSNADFEVVKKEYSIQFEKWTKEIYQELEGKLNTIQQKHGKAAAIMALLETEKLSQEQSDSFIELGLRLIVEGTKLVEEGENELKISRKLKSIIEESKVYIGFITQQYLNRFIDCPVCDKNEWELPRQFNMMFKTHTGAVEDDSSVVYLRPETAGGIFVNYKNVMDSVHPKLPFGIAQIGKAFRNEIAPRDFVFRVREFEQMEVEYFVKPTEWEVAFEGWRKTMHSYADALGLPKENLHELDVAAEDRAHYSKRTIDFEFEYPFGRKELWGLAYRTNFDLNAHQSASGVSLEYLDEETKDKFLPHVIEPSLGVDRTLLAVLSSAYREDDLGGETRAYLALSPKIAPIKAMVSPLLKNKPELVAKAKEVRAELQKTGLTIAWDDNGNIGKRYRRQDEIGTPFCITVDFDTLGEKPELEGTVTLRRRDTGEQERVSVADAADIISRAVRS